MLGYMVTLATLAPREDHALALACIIVLVGIFLAALAMAMRR